MVTDDRGFSQIWQTLQVSEVPFIQKYYTSGTSVGLDSHYCCSYFTHLFINVFGVGHASITGKSPQMEITFWLRFVIFLAALLQKAICRMIILKLTPTKQIGMAENDTPYPPRSQSEHYLHTVHLWRWWTPSAEKKTSWLTHLTWSVDASCGASFATGACASSSTSTETWSAPAAKLSMAGTQKSSHRCREMSPNFGKHPKVTRRSWLKLSSQPKLIRGMAVPEHAEHRAETEWNRPDSIADVFTSDIHHLRFPAGFSKFFQLWLWEVHQGPDVDLPGYMQ